MKKVIVIILVLTGLSLELKCQIVLGKDAISQTEKEIKALYVKGKTVKFEFDTLYFVNQLLIQDYYNTINKYNNLREISLGMIDREKERNILIDTDFKNLNGHIDNIFQMVRDSLALNNQRLDEWKVENSKLISINNQITVELFEAKEQIRKEKWNSTGNKMLYGVGGVIVGIGLGSLIIMAAK